MDKWGCATFFFVIFYRYKVGKTYRVYVLYVVRPQHKGETEYENNRYRKKT